MRTLLLALPFLMWGGGALAVEGKVLDLSAQVVDLRGDVVDLVYKVEDTGGAVQNLQVKETGQEIRIELAADVLFGFDSADVRPEAESTLREVAAFLRERAKGAMTRIEGHTDSKGSDSYNRKLSERRAAAVRNYLVEKEGLRDRIFLIKGLGETKPAAPNAKPDGSDNPEGRQKNRRVEIVVRKS